MMRVLSGVVVALAMVWTTVPRASGQRPFETAFGSGNGNYMVSIRASSPCEATSDATLYRWYTDGRQAEVLWKTALVNHPYCAWVDDRARWVVTMESRCSTSHEHALVVYGETGRVLRDFTLESLLTPEEIRTVQSRVQPEGGCDLIRTGGGVLFGDDSVSLYSRMLERTIPLWPPKPDK